MNVPVRGGKYMLKTTCGRDGAMFSSPERAMSHLSKQHRQRSFVPPIGDPIFKVKWNRKGMILKEIPLGPEMGETWGSVGPENTR